MPSCVHTAPARHGSRSPPNPKSSCPRRSPRCVPAGIRAPSCGAGGGASGAAHHPSRTAGMAPLPGGRAGARPARRRTRPWLRRARSWRTSCTTTHSWSSAYDSHAHRPRRPERGGPHPAAARAARTRAPLRRRGADPERGARGARRREDPGRAEAADQARVDRRAALGRAALDRARRPGLVEGRVVPRGGAARALDQRAVLAHAGRVQRARERHARADRALPEARPARRAARRVRRDRGRGGLRPVGHRHDRAPERRRLGDRRREVVRDLRRRGAPSTS